MDTKLQGTVAPLLVDSVAVLNHIILQRPAAIASSLTARVMARHCSSSLGDEELSRPVIRASSAHVRFAAALPQRPSRVQPKSAAWGGGDGEVLSAQRLRGSVRYDTW